MVRAFKSVGTATKEKEKDLNVTQQTQAKGGNLSSGSKPKHADKSLDEKVRELRDAASAAVLRRVDPIDIASDLTPSVVTTMPPEPMMVRPTDLWVDGSYQRNLSKLSLKLIVNMITGWSWQKFKPPVVTRDAEGRLVVIDGQHTSIGAASHPDIVKIPVMFIPIDSVQEAALAFLAHNTDRVLVTPYDKFQARITADDRVALDIRDVAQKYGITLVRWVGASGTGENVQPNQTLATGTLEAMYNKLGLAKFDNLLEHISRCGFKPIKREHITAFHELMYGDQKSGISPETLVDLVKSLNDLDCQSAAARIAGGTKGLNKGKALAMHYKVRYHKVYGEKR